jgi:diaminopimelate epimerase
MPIRFTKMHGLGNDYVYVDLFAQQIGDASALARAMSDRHCGIGSDGLILIAPSELQDAHARMIMYNADGSRGEMCGNGIRCVAKYVHDHGLSLANPLRIETDAGVLTLELMLDERSKVARVRVDMGSPRLRPEEIPVSLPGERVIDSLIDAEGTLLRMTCVSMGNPHAVVFVDQLAEVLLDEWGPAVETHALFPERVNVHFAAVQDRGTVQMLTWERGSGATLACGTGAAAVCVAGVLTERTDRSIAALLPGGTLQLAWPDERSSVFMTGPARQVFEGEWPVEA